MLQCVVLLVLWDCSLGLCSASWRKSCCCALLVSFTLLCIDLDFYFYWSFLCSEWVSSWTSGCVCVCVNIRSGGAVYYYLLLFLHDLENLEIYHMIYTYSYSVLCTLFCLLLFLCNMQFLYIIVCYITLNRCNFIAKINHVFTHTIVSSFTPIWGFRD